jgi:hypothetical protein
VKIVVDTNKYSGNFEREMCAFATAQIGECGVGAEEVDEAHPYASWWETHIQQVEDGCWRPVAISTTPGFINDGMGVHYKDTPENRKLANEAAVQKMIAYQAPQRAVIEKRLQERNFEKDNGGRGWTEEACLRTLKIYDETVARLRNNKSVFPAYQSIEIVVDTPPPGVVMMDFESRIYEFAKQNDIEILGIRIAK